MEVVACTSATFLLVVLLNDARPIPPGGLPCFVYILVESARPCARGRRKRGRDRRKHKPVILVRKSLKVHNFFTTNLC